MDPATAFQMACGVVQLIDAGIKVAKSLQEIYKSRTSSTRHNERVNDETSLLYATNSSLMNQLHDAKTLGKSMDHDQQRLLDMAQEVDRLARHLTDCLDRLKPPGELRRRDVPGQFIKIRRAKTTVEQTRSELYSKREIMDSQILVLLCRKMDTSDTRQREIILQLDISRLKSLRCFREVDQNLQNLISRCQNHMSEEMRETRQLMNTLDMNSKSRSNIGTLLESLRFPTMFARQESIHEAYLDTYRWIYDRTDDALVPWYNFVKWLESDDDLYWINGKAGSGKSTLMNYIVEDPRLESSLAVWAGPTRLIVPKFFFWRAGTSEQKSINGLLRSILYQVLSEDQKLASMIPETGKFMPTWTDKRLLKTVHNVLSQKLDIKICLVIDGLDEFEGDEDSKDSLTTLVKDLAQRSDMKVLVSSRPEPFLTEAFSTCKGLRLQDLTRRDIEIYVQGKLQKHPHMRSSLASEGHDVQNFIRKISQKADGVFLWAFLVVQDMLAGLRALDSFSMLEERLEHLESSLDGLFAQLLGRIHPVHRPRAADCLRYVSRRVDSDLEPGRVSLLHVGLAVDNEFSSNIQDICTKTMNDTSKIERCLQRLESYSTSIVAQTAGLLDVHAHHTPSAIQHHRYKIGVECYGVSPCNLLMDMKLAAPRSHLAQQCYHFNHHCSVGFVHRSAFEFIQDNKEAQRLIAKSKYTAQSINDLMPQSFEQSSQCMLLFIHEYLRCEGAAPGPVLDRDAPKHGCKEDVADVELGLFFKALGLTANWAEPAWRRKQLQLTGCWLTEAVKSIIDVMESKQVHLEEPTFGLRSFLDFASTVNPDHVLVVVLIRHGVLDLVNETLAREHEGSLASFCGLSLALCREIGGQRNPEETEQAVSYLHLANHCLTMGFDVEATANLGNQSERISAWMMLLSFIQPENHHIYVENLDDGYNDALFSLMTLFINSGADVNTLVPCEWTVTGDSVDVWQVSISLSVIDVIDMACVFMQRDESDLHNVVRSKGGKSKSRIYLIRKDAHELSVRGSDEFMMAMKWTVAGLANVHRAERLGSEGADQALADTHLGNDSQLKETENYKRFEAGTKVDEEVSNIDAVLEAYKVAEAKCVRILEGIWEENSDEIRSVVPSA